MWGRFPSGSLQGSVLYLFIFLDDVAAEPKAPHEEIQPHLASVCCLHICTP